MFRELWGKGELRPGGLVHGELKIRFVGHCRNEICTRARRTATYTLRRGWYGVIGGTKMIVIATVVTARNFATLYSVERRKQSGHERADRTSKQ